MAVAVSSSPSPPLRAFLGIVLVLLFAHAADAQLSPGFYRGRCPGFRRIVRQEMRRALSREPRLGASILRLFFHDCFVLGCDASLLLDGEGEASEKNSIANRNSARGFEVIDAIKRRIERRCPGVVSCADILALATREGVWLLGGPSFRLGLGRRDSLRASFSGANSDLPSPFSNLNGLISSFRAKGLSVTDLTALSGAHTLGFARCAFFRGRNANGNNIDPVFAARFGRRCSNINRLAPLDRTPRRFDNNYYRRLIRERGFLNSDQVLFNNGTTDRLVLRYAFSRRAFFRDFRAAMTRMSNIKPLTGSQGEIRRNCRAVN